MKIQYESTQLVIFESALFRTTSSLVIAADYLLLVDPNWLPIEIEFIEKYIQKVGANKKKYLLFTHSDYDHIIGYGRFSDYETIASENFTKNPNPQAILDQIHTFDDENYIQRAYPMVYPRIDHPIAGDGTSLQIASDTYVFYQARGHNADGLLSFYKREGILIVGDYLSNIEFPYLYDSLAAYHATLDKLDKLIARADVKFLITGHGDMTNQQAEMKLRIQESRTYLKTLETAVRAGEEMDLEPLFQRYHFPKVMTRFHQGNVALVKKEIARGNV